MSEHVKAHPERSARGIPLSRSRGMMWRWAAVFAAAVTLALAPGEAAAQPGCDLGPECEDAESPTVSISPAGGTFARPDVAVVISFADDIGVPSPAAGITFNGRAESPAGWQSDGMPSEGTLSRTLRLVPGTNVLTARMCDAMANCTTATATFEHEPSFGVVVTPDAGVKSVSQGAGSSQVFTVTNTSTAAAKYNLAATCAGAASACATAASITVAAGATGSVTVTFTAGAAGSSGSVRLRATDAERAQTWNEGWVEVAPTTASGTQPAPLVDVAGANAGITAARELCVTASAGSGAALECGDLRLVHALPVVTTMNKARAPVLLYGSSHAQPGPLVAANVTIPAGGRTPTRVTAALKVGATLVDSREWAGGEWSPGVARRITLRYTQASSAPDVVSYTVEVTAWYGTTPVPQTATGQLLYVDRRLSSFGRGWWLAGLERIHVPASEPTSRLWVGGDGSAVLFRNVAPNVWVAPALDGVDTLKLGTEYWRALPSGGTLYYDASGRLVRATNGAALTTHFHYTTDATYGERLDSIRAPVPGGHLATHRFHYSTFSDGAPRFRLDSVRSRAVRAGQLPRRVALSYATGTSRVTGIMDPDGRSVTLAYEDATAPDRVTRRTDRRGFHTTFAYDAAGKLAQVTSQVGGGVSDVVRGFQAAESRGFGVSVALANVTTVVDGPRTDVPDEVVFWTDRLGQTTRVRDPLGAETTVTRGDARFPALATRVVSPSGQIVAATYDARGNILTSTDSSTFRVNADGSRTYATSRYEWHPSWSVVTKVVTPEQNASPQADSTTLSYLVNYPLRWQVTAPGGEATLVSYDPTTRQVAKVVSPEARADTVGYDGLGNVAWTQSPSGIRTEFLRDSVGRVETKRQPIDATLKVVTTTVLDVMDQVVEERTDGPAMTYLRDYGGWLPDESRSLPAEWVKLVHTYDDEGNRLSTTRSAAPMPTGIGSLTTSWTYDGLGRVLTETAPDGAIDRIWYDPAGNAVRKQTRRGHVLRMEYDARGALLRRIVPEVQYAGAVETPTGGSGTDLPWYFPRFKPNAAGLLEAEATSSTPFVIPREISEFTYDAAGRMLTATNPWSRVTRSWNANGSLATDSLHLATYAGALTTGVHAYGLAHAYDLDGRPVALTHPGTIAPRVGAVLKDRETVEYDVNGRLKAINDVMGNRYAYQYHPDGQVREFLSPTGYRTTWGYDTDGMLARRTEKTPAPMTIRGVPGDTVLHDDRFVYDRRGKATLVHTPAGRVRNAFSGLGMLVWHLTEDGSFTGPADPGSPETVTAFSEERFTLDALGNQIQMWSRMKPVSADIAAPTYTDYTYQATTGRMTGRAGNRDRQQSVAFAAGTAYDPAGNTVREEDAAAIRKLARSYYDAEDRLRLYDRRSCWIDNYGNCQRYSGQVKQPDRSTFEEHRYDALGRRILTRTRQDFNCATGTNDCDNTVRRFVWNGDHLLYEVRQLGHTGATAAEMERDTGFVAYPGGQSFLGRVSYVNGPEIDRPLAFIRMDYSPYWRGPEMMYPHRTWRGQIDVVSYATGDWADRCVSGTDRPNYLCITVVPPARSTSMTYARTSTVTIGWFGGLLDNMRDASGNLYMRNRMYDPESGKFTQEDPIGLAGGVNLYGFANGDPASFADPYGLYAMACPPCETGDEVDLRSVALDEAKQWFSDLADRAVGIAVDASNFVGEVSGMWDFVRAGFGIEPTNAMGPSVGVGGRAAAAGLLVLSVPVPNARVVANLNRTVRAAQGADVAVTQVGRFYRASWEVAGTGGGLSRTRWVKDIAPDGRTLRMYHDTYDRAGHFMHRKFKYPDVRRAN
jgi:RHS repeat-associated protein